MIPLSITLDEITIMGTGAEPAGSMAFSFQDVMLFIYLFIVAAGLVKLMVQLAGIARAILGSERFRVNGTTLVASPSLHASSFFCYIFANPDCARDESFYHVLEHEHTHRREFHSIDRILAELFVIINWFNPVVWLYRKSVIENLEYLADSAVVKKGTASSRYQLSILNQYIGSASITNQFSSQIKNRIKMLNKNYRTGSPWKLLLVLPMVVLALFLLSCTKNEHGDNHLDPVTARAQEKQVPEVFYIVEEMPTFNGGDAATEFRKYIAQNVRYPEEAARHGITGKVFIKFIVTKEGKVVVPDQATVASIEGKPLDEVVVVGYRKLAETDPDPGEEYIRLLKDETIRVIKDSPDWEPGVQRGYKVNVMFTFPINFTLQ